MLYVIIISHSGGREKLVLSSRVNRRFIFIHQRKRKMTPDEKKSNQKEKQYPLAYLTNGLKLSYRAESFIFAKNRTHPGLTF